jgi:hypothetical protein
MLAETKNKKLKERKSVFISFSTNDGSLTGSTDGDGTACNAAYAGLYAACDAPHAHDGSGRTSEQTPGTNAQKETLQRQKQDAQDAQHPAKKKSQARGQHSGSHEQNGGQ